MDSDDDWENAVEDIVEDKIKEEVAAPVKFVDEDAHDSDEETKKQNVAKLNANKEPAR